MICFLFFNVNLFRNRLRAGGKAIPTVKIPAITWALPALGLFCACAGPVEAAGYVLGDSYGLGVSMAGRLKNLSRISVHIRGPKALEQFAQTPPGSTVFLTLGTNDANGSIARLDKSIDAIVAAAEKKNITLIWMGPPCVRQPWDTRARELDAMLREKLAGTSVRYVSMRDEQMCSGDFHERDGVHLKGRGYADMWEKARAAAGFEVASVEPADRAIRTGSIPVRVAVPLPRPRKAELIPLPIPRRPPPRASYERMER
jgi:hypothetical protein